MKFKYFPLCQFTHDEIELLNNKTISDVYHLLMTEERLPSMLASAILLLIISLEKAYVLEGIDELQFIRKRNTIDSYFLNESFLNASFFDTLLINNIKDFQPSVLCINVNAMYGGHLYFWEKDNILYLCAFRCIVPHLTDETQNDIKLEEIIFSLFLKEIKKYVGGKEIILLYYIAPSNLLQGVLIKNRFEPIYRLCAETELDQKLIQRECLPSYFEEIPFSRQDYYFLI